MDCFYSTTKFYQLFFIIIIFLLNAKFKTWTYGVLWVLGPTPTPPDHLYLHFSVGWECLLVNKSQLSQGREIWRYYVKRSMLICLRTAHWKVLEYFLPNVSSWNALLHYSVSEKVTAHMHVIQHTYAAVRACALQSFRGVLSMDIFFTDSAT